LHKTATLSIFHKKNYNNNNNNNNNGIFYDYNNIIIIIKEIRIVGILDHRKENPRIFRISIYNNLVTAPS